MAISINNTTGNILCLTKVPNIIEYSPGTTTGSFTQIVISIADNTENTGQKVVIDGITVSTDNFLLTKNGKQSAMNLSNALNNTSLIAEWKIWFTGNSVYLKREFQIMLLLTILQTFLLHISKEEIVILLQTFS